MFYCCAERKVQHSRMKGKQVTLAHAQQLFAQERETVLVSAIARYKKRPFVCCRAARCRAYALVRDRSALAGEGCRVFRSRSCHDVL